MNRVSASRSVFSFAVFGFALSLGSAPDAFGGRVAALFDCTRRKLVPAYATRVAALRSGDRVFLCESGREGKSVTVDRRLGQGDRAIVFSIRERPESALRLPRYPGEAEYLTETVRGAELLPEQAAREGMRALVARLHDGDFIPYREFSDFNGSRAVLRRRLRRLREVRLEERALHQAGRFLGR